MMLSNLNLSLTALRGGTSAATIASLLFASSEPGAWYDPSDLSTMYTDNGVTNVTTPGQTVYRHNDKSGRGNHRIQATASKRPTYGVMPKRGVVNILTGTVTLGTQSKTVTAAQHTLSFKGTGTVTLSGASTAGPLVGTGAGNRVSLTFTPSAGSLTLTVSGTVTEAQLQLGAAFDSYQAVTTIYDVTEAGQATCHYLAYDGVDDAMATAAAVDFTVTDKVTVLTGVRKESDASTGMLLEHGPTVNGTIGTFSHILPDTTSAGSLGLDLHGDGASGIERVSTGTAPAFFVSATVFDLSGTTFSTERPTKRINGAAATVLSSAGSTDSGGGNFTSQTMHFGARAGTSFYFSGYDFGLVVRGVLTSGATLTSAESLMSANTPTVTL